MFKCGSFNVIDINRPVGEAAAAHHKCRAVLAVHCPLAATAAARSAPPACPNTLVLPATPPPGLMRRKQNPQQANQELVDVIW